MLGIEELSELEKSILEELKDGLLGRLTLLNRNDKLEEALEVWGLEHLLIPESYYSVYKTGKIIVVGQTDVQKNVLLSVAKGLGLDKNRFELFLNYNDAVGINFGKYQWDQYCSAIMFGPTPHSGKSKGNYSSIITALENTEGYPPVKRMGSNALKITKSNFRATLEELIKEGIILK